MIAPKLFLNFFGTSEFLLIALVIIFLFGPKKLPELARNFGKFMRKVKDAQSSIVSEIKKGTSDLDDSGTQIHKQLLDTKKDIESIKDQVTKDVKKATHSISRKS